MADLSEWNDYVQLKRALRCKDIDTVRSLINSGVKINIKPSEKTTTPLHLAVSLGCLDIVKLLVDKGASIVDINKKAEIPLITAVKIGRLEIADYLLSVIDQENLENYSDREGITLMHIACMRNKLTFVKKFVEHGSRYINRAVSSKSQFWPGFTPLHFAVQYHCTETVEFLLSCGADITVGDVKKSTPLHLAFFQGKEDIIDIILSYQLYEIKNPMNSDGLSHFHIACTRDYPNVVQSFITHGADINMSVSMTSVNWSLLAPIDFAIEYECINIIKLLLSYNDHLHLNQELIERVYDTRNKEILDLIMSRHLIDRINKTNEIKNLSDPKVFVDIFLEVGNVSIPKFPELNWSYWTGYTPLHLAVKHRNPQTVQVVLANINDIVIKDATGKTPLHHAFEAFLNSTFKSSINESKVIDILLAAHETVSENPSNNDGISHFHISCTRTNVKVIESLLENNVDINDPIPVDSKFWPGFTPLHLAIEFRQDIVVKLLIQNGADLTIKNKAKLTPYDLAVMKFDDDSHSIMETILLKVSESKIESFNDHGFSLLHIYCMKYSVIEVEKYFNLHPEKLNKQVNWTRSNYYGYTPLEFVFCDDDEGVISDFLLENGASLLIKNKFGTTLLHKLIESDFYFKFDKSVFKSADLNDLNADGRSYLHLSCERANHDFITFLIEEGVDVNKPTVFKNSKHKNETPLLLLLSGEELAPTPETIQMMIYNGADINACDVEFNTPLHKAMEMPIDYSNAVKVLLDHGADVNSQNLYYNTPLHLLCNCNSSEKSSKLVHLLLKNGADVNMENQYGKTAFMVPNLAYKILIPLVKHVKKLLVLGYGISDKNKKWYKKNLSEYQKQSNYRDDKYGKRCLKELEQLKQIYIDNYTTLYNILYKNVNQMVFHSENNLLKQYVNSNDFYEVYPVYASLIHSQFKQGLTRKPFLQESRIIFKSFSELSLPDSCLDYIFEFLNNKDLKNIMLSVKKNPKVA